MQAPVLVAQKKGARLASQRTARRLCSEFTRLALSIITDLVTLVTGNWKIGTHPRITDTCVLIFFIPWLYLPLACGERAQDPSGRA